MGKHHPSFAEYVRIIAPAVVAVILFLVVVFGLLLPTYRQTMIDDKKDMIRELTRTAWNLLVELEEKERSGEMTRQEAQQEAIKRIRGMRYGDENKDYFWINDMRPYMVMHPYRSDLEGHDISDFTDQHGVHLFVKFVEAVEKQNENYITYMWQWKDNPDNIVPKLSFVKGFTPWGWIIGTGIYIEDVRQEVSLLTRRLVFISLSILSMVSLLSVLLVMQTLKASRLRKIAENELLEFQNHLVDLVEERTKDLLQANLKLSNEIIERQKAGEVIQQQRDLLKTVVESLPYPFYVINAVDHEVMLANAAGMDSAHGSETTCHLLSHSNEKKCNKCGDDFCPMDTVIHTRKPTIKEHIHIDENGRTSHLEVHGYPIFNKSGEVKQLIEYVIDITNRKLAEKEKENLIAELQKAFDDIKKLEGIIPICSFCKQIRDDKGYWNQLEKYVSEHSHAEFSHSICPKCMEERYPDIVADDDKKET